MNQPINRTMTATEWSLLVILSILWAGSFFYIGVAVKQLPPLTIVAFRVAVGGALLYLVVRLTGGAMPADWKTWRAFLTMGILNNVVPFSLIAWGQGYIASGLASILNATTPLFTLVIAHYLTHDERMNAARVAGLIIGFIGVVILIGVDALAGAGEHLLAELAVLLASVFYALSAIFGRRFSRMGLPPLTTAAGQISSAAFIMVPASLIVDQPWTLSSPSLGVWASLFGLAVLATVVAYVIFYRVLATAGSVNLMLVTFMVPVGAILLGALFLDERLAANHFVGMAAIGIGLAAIDGRPLRLLQRRA